MFYSLTGTVGPVGSLYEGDLCPGDRHATPTEIAAHHQARAVQLLTATVQNSMDDAAKAAGYDNLMSACSYAAQPEGEPFQAEGAAFLRWRSAVWVQANAILAEVQAGTRPIPALEQALAAMPPLDLHNSTGRSV